MAVLELSMVTGAIVETGVEGVWEKVKHRETVIRVLSKVGLKPDVPPSDFDGVYAYTLVEYGVGKPKPILDFFRLEYIRQAFRQSFETQDASILGDEADTLIEWHKVGDELRQLDIDPRREFAQFTAVFNEIVDRTRTPAEIRRDQKLDNIYGDLHLKTADILDRLSKLDELHEIRQELARLGADYEARRFIFVPTGEKLKVFISSKLLELRDVREVVTHALNERGIEAWVYEAHAGARPEGVVETSLREVEAADIYVGLFWQKFGEVTVREYRHARELSKPCFVYVRDRDCERAADLQSFLTDEVFELAKGVTYDFFDSAIKLGQQIGHDIMTWLVRRHREMTAEIREARVSLDEIARLQAEVQRLQAATHHSLPQGTPADYLAQQMRAWFETLGYRFEGYGDHTDTYFEWIIDVPTRRGHDRILVRGVEGEAELGDVQALRQAVNAQHCDEGWLIAPRRVSQLARQEVCDKANSDLFCYTFDELLDEAADFTGYLNWLEGEIKRRGIDREYIPLACSKEELDPRTGVKIGESRYDQENGWIDGYVERWLDDPSKEHISVLGEFGTGKTWFALHYAWIALLRYRIAKERGTERPRLPLVIPLRDYARSVSVESLFSEFFFRKHEIPLPNYSAFEQLNRMGKLLLIFDGFDEMAAKIDRQLMIDNFWELARVVTFGAKVILTCRKEHFPTAQEGRALLGAELQASTARLTGEPPQFEVLELAKFDKDQIRQALLLRTVPAVAERIMENEQLLDLASRPLMVDLILEALPDIEAGKPIDLARVYLYAVRQKMERDIRAERTFTSLADKLYFLCEVSWEMLSTERMNLNYRSFPDRLKRLFGPAVGQQVDLDHWYYDMMSQTMLVRNSDGDYAPAHRSLLEFFTAFKFAGELGVLPPDFQDVARAQSHIDRTKSPIDYAWSGYFRRELEGQGKPMLIAPLREFVPDEFALLATTIGLQELSAPVLALASDMASSCSASVRERLISIIRCTAGRTENEVGYLGGNAASILLKSDRTAFRGLDLRGVSLRGAATDEDEVDLAGCDLSSANLRDVSFGVSNALQARFCDSDLEGATLFSDGWILRCGVQDSQAHVDFHYGFTPDHPGIPPAPYRPEPDQILVSLELPEGLSWTEAIRSRFILSWNAKPDKIVLATIEGQILGFDTQTGRPLPLEDLELETVQIWKGADFRAAKGLTPATAHALRILGAENIPLLPFELPHSGIHPFV